MNNTLEQLLLGNKKYLTECAYTGDITFNRRCDTSLQYELVVHISFLN